MQDKTREEHFKQAKKNVKDVFKTPLKVVGDIFSNPLTAIFKLPSRALEMISNAVAATIELATASGKKGNEKTPSALMNPVQPRVRSAWEKKDNTSRLV